MKKVMVNNVKQYNEDDLIMIMDSTEGGVLRWFDRCRCRECRNQWYVREYGATGKCPRCGESKRISKVAPSGLIEGNKMSARLREKFEKLMPDFTLENMEKDGQEPFNSHNKCYLSLMRKWHLIEKELGRQVSNIDILKTMDLRKTMGGMGLTSH